MPLDAIQNELQYRIGGIEDALKGNIQKDAAKNSYVPNIGQRLLGITEEQLTNAANTGQRNRFNDTELGQKAAGYGIDLGNGSLNIGSIGKKVREAEGLEQATKLYIANGGDLNKIKGLDIAGVSSLNRTQLETNTNNSWMSNPQVKQEQKRYFDLQQDKLADKKEARDQLAYNREESDARRMSNKRESALDRRHSQNLAILSNDHQMQLAQMNQGLTDKRMEYDRETRRMDKRDRLIAQLMSGLGSLGGAFSM